MVGDLQAAALGNATGLRGLLPAAVLSGEPDRQRARLVEIRRPIRIVGHNCHAVSPSMAGPFSGMLLVENQVGENRVLSRPANKRRIRLGRRMDPSSAKPCLIGRAMSHLAAPLS